VLACWPNGLAVLNSLAIMGGTFDPIHIGHLRSALEAVELLNCDELRFIPCHQPPHRATPSVTSLQRLHMIELAIADQPGFRVDAREIKREGPSYTIDTLTDLRGEVGADCALHLLIGMDAFVELDTWRRWDELINFANIIVMQRPDNDLPQRAPIVKLLLARHTALSEVKKKSHGAIAIVQLTPLPISATAIRDMIRIERSPRYLLPDAVWQFIREQHLYI
jgi:nicotinate-nucleotide adenylyltransferase